MQMVERTFRFDVNHSYTQRDTHTNVEDRVRNEKSKIKYGD